MSPLDRLLLESVPVRPEARKPAGEPWTQAERDAHWAALCRTVGTPNTQRPNPTVNERQTAA
ncbi:hypothetical protein [Streptomyces sp. NPDC085596]|uniref:hypothetical protein n=1 Tax=Streptomyces sp. NPDC085596 TaxID=3365731 RepID=UPI0037CD3853